MDDADNPILDGMIFALDVEETTCISSSPNAPDGVFEGLVFPAIERSPSSALFESPPSMSALNVSSPDFAISRASSTDVSDSFLDYQCFSAECCSSTVSSFRPQADCSQSAPADTIPSRIYNRKSEEQKTPDYYALRARSNEYVRRCRLKKKGKEAAKDMQIALLQTELEKEKTERIKQTAISETLKKENDALLKQLGLHRSPLD